MPGERRVASRRVLESLVRRIGGTDPRVGGALAWRETGDREVVGVLPAADRRSVLWRATGASPLLFRHTALEQGPRCNGEKVHLYLDVSGSVEKHLGKLFAAARDVANLVWRDVHLFSTDVEDVPMRELERGVCQTTGGTSLVPVVRHIRQHQVCRAVIVTDGQVGCIGARDRETLGEMILGVALTSGEERNGELAGLARHVVVLPGL
ncbi:MAG TPA: hypothetical protein PLL76_17750 [Thermoanaerobaculia bacterium]|nr:hypothetical protein [Thermoanaerobaculia bacterium]HQP88097.1 hypothetical protein [Thermoanaerobaculia bacterium]